MTQLHLRRVLLLSAGLVATFALTACGSIGLHADMDTPLGFHGDRDRWHGDRPHWDRGDRREWRRDRTWERDADWRWDHWDRNWDRGRRWDRDWDDRRDWR